MDKLIIGCGYLGKRVAALWHAQGQRVFATTRRADDSLGPSAGPSCVTYSSPPRWTSCRP